MKKAIKFLFRKLGYEMYRIPNALIFIKNHFNKNNKKSALLSYITRPFEDTIYYHHTNGIESIEIASLLDELGFNVDIINWDNKNNNYISYEQYDLIFGFGEPMENSFLNRNCKAKRIFYCTGCHPYFQNRETLKRVRDLYDEKGYWLLESATLANFWTRSLHLSDAMFVLGNDFAVETWKKTFLGEIKKINVSSIKTFSVQPKDKNFNEARYHFLWFGSSGLVHKGLDIVLRAFSQLPTVFLHVCGMIDHEPLFKKAFFKELYETPNIKTYGFIDIRSELFENLLKKCAFSIFPSASEGNSPSQINVMRNGGLIPIITDSCGLDVDNLGFKIPNTHIETIITIIKEATKMSDKTLFEQTQQSLDFAQKNHSLECFRETLKKHLCEILQKNNFLCDIYP